MIVAEHITSYKRGLFLKIVSANNIDNSYSRIVIIFELG